MRISMRTYLDVGGGSGASVSVGRVRLERYFSLKCHTKNHTDTAERREKEATARAISRVSPLTRQRHSRGSVCLGEKVAETYHLM